MRYVFLDRDGVINRKPPEVGYVTNWSEFAWLPGAIEAIGRMNRAGLTVIVVTNQRGIALGLYTEAQLQQIHRSMLAELAQQGAKLDAIYYCPHDRGECQCRKPATGLFEKAMKDFPGINAQNSIVIGDSLSDIQAGQNLDMKTIFIGQQKPEAADALAGSLLQAVEMHLKLIA